MPLLRPQRQEVLDEQHTKPLCPLHCHSVPKPVSCGNGLYWRLQSVPASFFTTTSNQPGSPQPFPEHSDLEWKLCCRHDPQYVS